MRARSLVAVDVVSGLDLFFIPGWVCVMWDGKSAESSANIPYSFVSTSSVTS